MLKKGIFAFPISLHFNHQTILYAYPKMSKQLVLSDEMDDFRQNWKNRS